VVRKCAQFNPAAECVDAALHDRESEPQASKAACAGVGQLRKGFLGEIEYSRAEARTGVTDLNFDRIVG